MSDEAKLRCRKEEREGYSAASVRKMVVCVAFGVFELDTVSTLWGRSRCHESRALSRVTFSGEKKDLERNGEEQGVESG